MFHPPAGVSDEDWQRYQNPHGRFADEPAPQVQTPAATPAAASAPAAPTPAPAPPTPVTSPAPATASGGTTGHAQAATGGDHGSGGHGENQGEGGHGEGGHGFFSGLLHSVENLFTGTNSHMAGHGTSLPEGAEHLRTGVDMVGAFQGLSGAGQPGHQGDMNMGGGLRSLASAGLGLMGEHFLPGGGGAMAQGVLDQATTMGNMLLPKGTDATVGGFVRRLTGIGQEGSPGHDEGETHAPSTHADPQAAVVPGADAHAHSTPVAPTTAPPSTAPAAAGNATASSPSPANQAASRDADYAERMREYNETHQRG
jgi:hypothetical protein